MASIIDTHPKRGKILEAILSGKSLRTVAKMAGCSHTVVADYKRKVVAPAVRDARKLADSQELPADRHTAIAQHADLTRRVIAADPLRARVEKYAKGLENAFHDELANPERDNRGLAAVASAGLKAVESAARLELHPGFVPQAPVVNQQILVAVFRPGESPSESHAGTVIDVDPAEEIDMRPRNQG